MNDDVVQAMYALRHSARSEFGAHIIPVRCQALLDYIAELEGRSAPSVHPEQILLALGEEARQRAEPTEYIGNGEKPAGWNLLHQPRELEDL